MRYLLPVLLLASLGLAIQFGPAGMPLDWRNLNIEWMESSKFTSSGATSYLSMDGDTLFYTLTGVSGDRDIMFKMVEEDGTKHKIWWDDGGGYWYFDTRVRSGADFKAGNSIYGTTGLYTEGGLATYFLDVNDAGSGTLTLGETGDNDTTRVVGLFESDNISSQGATSYLSMAGDTLFVTRTGTAGDHDQVICFVDESGNKSCITSDDALDYFNFSINTITPISYANEFIQAAAAFTLKRGATGFVNFESSSARSTILLDPNDSGAGTNQLGQTGDNDITLINSRLRTNITTVDTTTVMGAADGYMFTMTADDTLKCPVTPLAGEVLMCKFTNASGGMLFGNGNTIDGASEVAASENDNIMIVWNATTSDWEIR